MGRTLEDPEEDEAGRQRGVEDTQEDQSWNHEREWHLLVHLVAKRSKSGRCIILCPGVDVHNGCGHGEYDDLANGDGPERLGKVLWFLHLSYETGYSDLTDKGVADIQKGIHSIDETSPCGWNDQDYGIPSQHAAFAAAWRIVTVGMSFYSRKDGSQKDREECEDSREGRKLRKSVERSGKRAEEGKYCPNRGKANGTYCATAHGIKVFGAN